MDVYETQMRVLIIVSGNGYRKVLLSPYVLIKFVYYVDAMVCFIGGAYSPTNVVKYLGIEQAKEEC